MPYQFKGINIEDIIDTSSNPTSSDFNNVYKDLPKSMPSEYNNSKLLDNLNLGFSYTSPSNGETNDLSTVCSAKHAKYDNTEHVNVPTGANQFRYFIRGASGGGGGGGGCSNNSGRVQKTGGSGGHGAAGSSAEGIIDDLTNTNVIDITIGAGGSAGRSGNAEWSNNDGSVQAGGGGSGGKGGATNIHISTSVLNKNAAGGAGGGAGGGGWTWAGWFNTNTGGGAGGGNSGDQSKAAPTNWDSYYVTTQDGGGVVMVVPIKARMEVPVVKDNLVML